MVLAKRLDLRIDERDPRFNGEFSLRLIPNDNEGKIIAIRPLDVSKRGLGFVVRESLKNGGFYFLMIGEQRFRVEIAYCNSHLGIDNLYRCGLFLREADGNLHDACQHAGLLSDYHPDRGST
jgi:hypothetical protein